MSTGLMEVSTARAPKRKAVKASIRPSGAKLKATVCLSPEAIQRLAIHATGFGLDRSELVEKLINDHLRRFVLTDRGGPSATQDISVGEA